MSCIPQLLHRNSALLDGLTLVSPMPISGTKSGLKLAVLLQVYCIRSRESLRKDLRQKMAAALASSSYRDSWKEIKLSIRRTKSVVQSRHWMVFLWILKLQISGVLKCKECLVYRILHNVIIFSIFCHMDDTHCSLCQANS